MITPKLITAPTVEPITLTEVKEHLRIDHSSEDDWLEFSISVARQHFEWRTGRTLHQTTWEIALECFPWGSLPIILSRAAPLVSVTYVKYKDSDGVEHTWDSSNYIVDDYEDVGRIAPAYGQTYPSFTHYPLNPIKIRYVAGIANGSPQTFPEKAVRRCLAEMVGGLYENRESIVAFERGNVEAFMENPATLMLMEQYKVQRAF